MRIQKKFFVFGVIVLLIVGGAVIMEGRRGNHQRRGIGARAGRLLLSDASHVHE